MDDFLKTEYEQCFSLIKYYDERHQSLVKYASGLSGAIPSLLLAIFQLGNSAEQYFWQFTFVILLVATLGLAAIYTVLIQTRLYFIYPVRQVNSIRRYCLEQLKGNEFDNQMYLNTSFNAFKWFSSHTLLNFFVSMQVGTFAGLTTYVYILLEASQHQYTIGISVIVGFFISLVLICVSASFWRPKWLSEKDVRNANQNSYSEKLDYYFDISSNKFTHPVENESLVGNPNVSGGVTITKHASSDCGTSNINNHSGVVVFEYCGVKVVIPGDNEPPSWSALLKQQKFADAVADAHLFLASHHGRKSGHHSDLFKTIKPKLCVVSDGRIQDTDATSRYSQHAAGWSVTSKSTRDSKERRCLTTRSDGFIEIEIGKVDNGKPFLSVSTS